MSEINLLSPHVADLIAAGEVVDRPASVVKELLENAFDADARTVTVELRTGGITYIRVTDDGKGMSPEDAGIAFLRHATSKLRDERGLESIGTFGFRGEALAAVSAVSRIEMTSRVRGAESGVRMTLTAGDIQDMYETGCPEGTTMIVRDLFFNTPARLKFLKTDRAEGAACVQAAMKCALGRPDISVRCIKDGKEEFFSPGDGKMDSCIYHLLGRDVFHAMIPCLPGDGEIRVRGYISSPEAGRGNRSNQFFFVNGRAIRSQMLQSALEMAYRNRLLTGRFPSCVLYVDIAYGAVDVNVHPTKAEVKFSQEKKVFDAVYYTCLEAVGREDRLADEAQRRARSEAAAEGRISLEGTLPKDREDPTAGVTYDPVTGRINPTEDGRELKRYDIPLYKNNGPMTLRDGAVPATPVSPAENDLPPRQESEPPRDDRQIVIFGTPAVPAVPAPESPVSRVETPAAEPLPAQTLPVPQAEAAPEPLVPAPPQSASPAPEETALAPARQETFRVVGEVLSTYIIVEHGEKMTLIDKHAAHERIHFDRLSAQQADPQTQTLLTPESLRLGREDLDFVQEHLEDLTGLGYEIDVYEQDTLLLRGVPAGMDPGDARGCIEEVCGALRAGKRVSYQQARQEILKTVACKAAIKAGRRSEPEELAELARAVLAGEIQYCPHGRPVSITYSKTELDKLFDRIV